MKARLRLAIIFLLQLVSLLSHPVLAHPALLERSTSLTSNTTATAASNSDEPWPSLPFTLIREYSGKRFSLTGSRLIARPPRAEYDALKVFSIELCDRMLEKLAALPESRSLVPGTHCTDIAKGWTADLWITAPRLKPALYRYFAVEATQVLKGVLQQYRPSSEFHIDVENLIGGPKAWITFNSERWPWEEGGMVRNATGVSEGVIEIS